MSYIGNTATTQAFTPAVDYFSGNGSTTAFTLSRPVASVAQVEAVIDNVVQNPSSAYTVSSNTITFTSAPLSGTNNIYVRYTSPITQVIAPGQGTVNTTALGNITNIASGNSSLTLQTGSGNTTAVTVDTSQNVGIGTTVPTQKVSTTATSSAVGFDIQYNGSYQVASWTVNPPTGEIRFGGTNTTGTYFQTFYTQNTERMRIDSSGNFMFNTTSQLIRASETFRFNVGAGVASFKSNAGIPVVHLQNTSSVNTYQMAFSNSAGEVGTITTGTGSTAYNTSSDYRLKDNVAPMTGALGKVAQLKPVTYKWKIDGSDGEGFIAHELAEVCPHAVTGAKDAVDEEGNPRYQGIDTSFLVATLTAAIQEQQALINALTARVAALEA